MSNTTAHTPGPWAHDDGHIFTKEKGRKYNSIASIYEIYDNKGKPESNAKLITAAPDLLEALVKTRERMKSLLSNATPEFHAAWDILYGSNEINTAIEKATGK